MHTLLTSVRACVALVMRADARKRIVWRGIQTEMNRTPAESARTIAYSPDIGWRVMWQRLGMDLTFKQIAQCLQIAVGTAHRISKRFMNTGDVSATAQKKVPMYSHRKLDQYHELFILCMISENSVLYLAEICQQIQNFTNVSVSESTVCRLLYHSGCSRKKIVQVAKQRCLEYGGAFMAEVLQYRKDMFVFIDETGSIRRDHTRKFGYAIRGEAPVFQQWLIGGRRISTKAAITTEECCPMNCHKIQLMKTSF